MFYVHFRLMRGTDAPVCVVGQKNCYRRKLRPQKNAAKFFPASISNNNMQSDVYKCSTGRGVLTNE
jgi:hypothetical protein